MNSQKKYRDLGNDAKQRGRRTAATASGRARFRGRMWQYEERHERLILSELAGCYVERKTIAGYMGSGTVHQRAEPPDATAALHRGSAGSAFSWWIDQSEAERTALIARVMAENTRHAAGKKAGAVRKEKAPR